ncbi:SufE family protein [Candidatus Riesia pediculischaeffi]|uniref:Cysteine desufuration protein SufE n=2 Tax=Candidatus Riesia pediculischaeffi TaxID=428411 RepID=A0A1V0HKS3_9ENTR|nr:SufE family protein [Candidatus Riesia pediculischaeffi]ARC53428.1 cysteine desufuration protein SufE [Candidatus Riesia pediculischaeffi]KIE63948.1 Sulfur acceptor protein SufE for iron-sulfur cluster assembly [Candidatus Riesia pediculischaeffi PTSU]
MISSKSLPKEEKLLENFLRCCDLEQKYIYLMELGMKLAPLSKIQRTRENEVLGCQSKVWMVVEKIDHNTVHINGYSDTAIVRGLIAILVVLFNKKTFHEILNTNVSSFFKKLSIERYISPSRSSGLYSIVQNIFSRLMRLSRENELICEDKI